MCGPCQVPEIADAGPGLTCIVGAFEPGNPTSSYAFESRRDFLRVAFQRGMQDGGAPLTAVTLDVDLWPHVGSVSNPIPPVFLLEGDAGTGVVAAVPVGAAMVSGGGQVDVQQRMTVDAGGFIARPAIQSFPPMTWYSRCQGTAPLVTETDAEFCDGYAFNCGSLTATDSTGTVRTVSSCGQCSPGQVCRPNPYLSWTAQRCRACVVETDAQLCQRLGATCGLLTAPDDCDVVRTVDCGSCTAPSFCGGGGVANVCGGTAIVCSHGRVVGPAPVPNTAFCPDGDGGTTIDAQQTLTSLTFTWNPSLSRYEAPTTVPAIIPGPITFSMTSASATSVSWNGISSQVGTRSGNVVTVSGSDRRSSPQGCTNAFVFMRCDGSAPITFAP
ncbi:MAG: hypothetical protein ACOZQL_14300 [Myxococcota bacterium]